MTDLVFVIHLIQSATVILLDGTGGQLSVPAGRLPSGLQSGQVLRVPVTSDGRPLWHAAVVDDRVVLEEGGDIKELLTRLKGLDPED